MRGLACLGLLTFIARPAFGDGEVLPQGTIKKGTLANAKLIADAKLGVAAKVGVMGCVKPERLEPYVVAMPTGVPGRTAVERALGRIRLQQQISGPYRLQGVRPECC